MEHSSKYSDNSNVNADTNTNRLKSNVDYYQQTKKKTKSMSNNNETNHKLQYLNLNDKNETNEELLAWNDNLIEANSSVTQVSMIIL